MSSRVGAGVVLIIALLLTATSAYILFVPVEASNFEATTGIPWDTFTSSNPEAAEYLTREARLLAIGFLGVSLMTAAIAWGPVRHDELATPVLWVFPAVLFGAAGVFLASADTPLGVTYLAAGVIAAVAVAAADKS